MDAQLTQKYDSLRKQLRGLSSVAVAFSGGVDSTFLAKVAHDVLGDRVLAVTATSQTYPAAELESAKDLAAAIGVRQVVIDTNELEIPGFKHNPPDRCYHCKKELFEQVLDIAKANGLAHVADGTNADDSGDYRPGARAVRELGVLTPLRDVGMTKADIRAASKELGLPTWNKPAYACLASRFPYGDEITMEKLGMVERAEAFLRELGFEHCRVRHHGDVARIEVPAERIAELCSDATGSAVAERLKELGFQYVTVDLQGYRTGSMNETLGEAKDASQD